jgi:hypothetical protein
VKFPASCLHVTGSPSVFVSGCPYQESRITIHIQRSYDRNMFLLWCRFLPLKSVTAQGRISATDLEAYAVANGLPSSYSTHFVSAVLASAVALDASNAGERNGAGATTSSGSVFYLEYRSHSFDNLLTYRIRLEFAFPTTLVTASTTIMIIEYAFESEYNVVGQGRGWRTPQVAVYTF